MLDLIRRLLISDPDKRISWDNFFKHPMVATDPHLYKETVDYYNKQKIQQSK